MKTSAIKSILVVVGWLTPVLLTPAPSRAYECIASAETRSATIGYAGETHSYSFWGEPGQSVVIEMTAGTLYPRAQLFDPRGVRIADSGWQYQRAVVDNCKLKTPGIYTIVASNGFGTGTGEYELSLVVIPGATTSPQDRDGGDNTIGRTHTGTIPRGGDLDAYLVYGQVGQGVVIEVVTLGASGIYPQLRFYDPCGAKVADTGWQYTRAAIENYQLEKTGIYTIVVSNGFGLGSGAYGLSVSVMPPIDPHGLYPYEPQPADGSSLNYCDPNYGRADIVVKNWKLPDGRLVQQWSGGSILSWCSVLGALSYDVYLARGSCAPLEPAAQNLVLPYLPMPALDPNEVYYWQVVAHTATGDIQGPTWWFATAPCPFPSCSLTLSAIGRGSIVDPNAGLHRYSPGAVVPVTAVADPDYEFVRWEGSAVDANKVVVEHQDKTGSKVSVAVDGAYTLRAVFEEVVYDFPLDSDPGWPRNGQWQFGKPTGQGGKEYGHPDPTGGHTGQNVFGVDLNGDYDTAVGGPYSLVAGPFDLRAYENVHLRFWSWLNTDLADYVKNSLEVSLDGKTWLLVSHNPEREPVADSAWSRWECGIGPWVDGQPTVYLRWSYQVLTERAYPYSGWNLDDIQLIGRRQK
jgi:hypothetical protein